RWIGRIGRGDRPGRPVHGASLSIRHLERDGAADDRADRPYPPAGASKETKSAPARDAPRRWSPASGRAGAAGALLPNSLQSRSQRSGDIPVPTRRGRPGPRPNFFVPSDLDILHVDTLPVDMPNQKGDFMPGTLDLLIL